MARFTVFSLIALALIASYKSSAQVSSDSEIVDQIVFEHEYSDNFDDNALNFDFWHLYLGGKGAEIYEQGGRLEIHFQPPIQDAKGKGAFDGGLETLYEVTGDYDCQVEYSIIDAPDINGIRFGLHSDSSFLTILDIYPSGGWYQQFTTDFVTYENVEYPIQTRGKFRLSRVGNTYYAFVWYDGEWKLVHESERDIAPDSFKLHNWSHESVFADQKTVIAFDNFILKYQGNPVSKNLHDTTTITLSGQNGQTAAMEFVNIPVPINGKNLLMAKYETTQEQYLTLMGNNPSFFQDENSLQKPVETISWNDAHAFIQRLNSLGLGVFRLPTESEWEHVCRASTLSEYYWGDAEATDILSDYAWNLSNSDDQTHERGQLSPNNWGLYDMAGNVWEWAVNEHEPEGQQPIFGGSFADLPPIMKSAHKHYHDKDLITYNVGFRVVLEADTFDNINTAANFPDPNFRAAVEEFMGVEPGGVFSAEQARSMTGTLVANQKGIKIVDGIEFFSNLAGIDLHLNEISEIDLSNHAQLRFLQMWNNPLRSIDVSNNILLNHLNIENNLQIDYLDLSNNTELVTLQLGNSKFSEIDLSNNIKIETLSLINNEFDDISFLHSLPNLRTVDVRNNYLTCEDLADINQLVQQIGEATEFHENWDFPVSGLVYKQQKRISLEDCTLNINTAQFIPDNNLRSAIQSFMGVGETDIITMAEASLKEGVLDVSGQPISNLKGIEYFTNLDGLLASNCNLRRIDRLADANFIKNPFHIDIRHNFIGQTQVGNIIKLLDRYGEENVLYHPQNVPFQVDIQVRKWQGNDHFYGVIRHPSLWHWDLAVEFSNNFGGYLATLTSPEENEFVYNTFGGDVIERCIIGGIQDPNMVEQSKSDFASGWEWVTGEEFSYTNWSEGEPNQNLGLEEDILIMFSNGKWNDESMNGLISGLVVEWETIPDSTDLFNFVIDPSDLPISPELGGDELSAGPTQEILVPITAKSLDPLSAFSIEAVFDENVLEWTGELITDDSMIADWSFADANLVGNNRLIIASLGTDNIVGDGSLLYLKFVVKENAQISTNTSITFENPDGFGDVMLHPVTIEIGGMLGDLNDDGRISISDVQVLFDIVLRRIEPTASQQVSGDLNKDGRISITDVQALFDVVLQRAPLPAQVFEPLTRPQQVSQITIPDSSVQVGGTLIVPINLSSSEMMSAFEMTVNYDPALLNFVGMDTESTLTDSFSFIDANQTSSGVIIAAGLSTEEIQANGTLFFLEFEIQPGASGETQLELTNLDGDLFGWTVQSGAITLDASTMIRDFMRY